MMGATMHVIAHRLRLDLIHHRHHPAPICRSRLYEDDFYYSEYQ